jgi:glycosyltransferase involved in cell wall biosynthesis
MRWFFTCPRTSFIPLHPKRIFYCGSNWDRTRKGEAYKRLFAKLDETGDLSIYGPPKAWKHTPRSYRGFLPFDGRSTIKAMQECGIVLILHSETHLKGNAPTGRIFEAAASGCVIISDRHPFVMQEFGDSALYIDQEGSPEAIFQEIEDRLAWIRSNPKEAVEMAARCHEIFEERFTLEEQLLNLKKIYEEITQIP